jgi:hypothetical protein
MKDGFLTLYRVPEGGVAQFDHIKGRVVKYTEEIVAASIGKVSTRFPLNNLDLSLWTRIWRTMRTDPLGII